MALLEADVAVSSAFLVYIFLFFYNEYSNLYCSGSSGTDSRSRCCKHDVEAQR
jgi:hypothetical protein